MSSPPSSPSSPSSLSSSPPPKRKLTTKLIANAPEFVLKYAPYVYLHSEERFHPGDIAEHLIHTTPHLNLTPLDSSSTPTPLLLSNLEKLNALGPEDVYLTSNDDPTYPPPWLRGNRNIPDHYGKSKAPAIIIWTEKSPGVVDVFYFYFYSFNLGNTVAGWRFGNHVGDWEHTAIRFIDGSPLGMFFSEHSSGKAYQFSAVEKLGNRPITYSATGSHANYATPGTHYYAIPFHLLFDRTDKGYLWDPVKNNLLYHYDIKNDELTPDGKNPEAPVSWFHFEGKWGDMIYPLNDRRQYRVVGQYHYVNGPTGPKSKNLDRREICQNAGICTLLPSLKETNQSSIIDY
ncbi:hypothetical protein BZA77DRAFT_338593 [Pyronema omphalodes]|nr:hypothetical protein BZA77DRAFT_338593 [Pyronema omphalodes]